MGCQGSGFARSLDGGSTFQPPFSMPWSGGSSTNTWDPAIAVAPDGTIYVSYIVASGGQQYPQVDVWHDHGATFTLAGSITPPDPKNFGDRDFIAVGPDGTLYLTWDYGPTAHRSPTPNGRIDVLYQAYSVSNIPHRHARAWLRVLHRIDQRRAELDDSGRRRDAVRDHDPAGLVDRRRHLGGLGREPVRHLGHPGTNADGSANDIGWLSYSTDHGATWSAPVQAPADRTNVGNIIEVAGASTGTAYVGWLSASNPQGYAEYLRTFSITGGWKTAPTQISTAFGDPSVWAGDTYGISALSPSSVALSWGSATGKKSEVFAAKVSG